MATGSKLMEPRYMVAQLTQAELEAIAAMSDEDIRKQFNLKGATALDPGEIRLMAKNTWDVRNAPLPNFIFGSPSQTL